MAIDPEQAYYCICGFVNPPAAFSRTVQCDIECFYYGKDRFREPCARRTYHPGEHEKFSPEY